MPNRPTGISAEHYARQLETGFLWLRFSPVLEQAYREWTRSSRVMPTVVCGTLALVIWLGFATFDLIRVEFFTRNAELPIELWAALGLRWFVTALLVCTMILVRRMTNGFSWVVLGTYLSLAFAAAYTSHVYQFHNLPRADITLVIIVIAAFLPIGLSFYQSLGAACGAVALTLWMRIIFAPSGDEHAFGYLVLAMSVAIPVGAIGGYLREYGLREQFLLRNMLGHQAYFDPLTDLANRRMFERRAEKALAYARRQGDPVYFVALDIDHFKAFNDRYGHAAGDQALAKLAGVLRAFARRPLDIAARFGGEEFVLLLYGTDTERLKPELEKLRKTIAGIGVVLPDSHSTAPLTASMGAARFDGSESLDVLYRRADALLYGAKEAGRDRIMVETQSMLSGDMASMRSRA